LWADFTICTGIYRDSDDAEETKKRVAEETNRQVEMKRFIFRNARNLCFWLGEDANSKVAIPFIRRMLEPIPGIPGITAIDQLINEQEVEGWSALVALLKNSVFSRLWFVQEVAVARNVTLHCGPLAIHYKDLVDAVSMSMSKWDDISHLFRSSQTTNHKDLIDRRLRMAVRFIDVSTNALRTTGSGLQRLLSLEALVSLLSDLGCAKELDRIYSVLMIARDGPSWNEETFMKKDPPSTRQVATLTIDYGRTVLEVYQDFVVHATMHSNSLNIICRHWASSAPETMPLPTWVRPLQSSLPAPLDKNVSGRTAADSR